MGFFNEVIKWFEYYIPKRMCSVNVENSLFDKAV